MYYSLYLKKEVPLNHVQYMGHREYGRFVNLCWLWSIKVMGKDLQISTPVNLHLWHRLDGFAVWLFTKYKSNMQNLGFTCDNPYSYQGNCESWTAIGGQMDETRV